MIPKTPEELTAFSEPEELLISEWAERHMPLGKDSADKGTWKADVTPYLVPVMDAALDPFIKEIVVCASAQSGKTQGFLAIDTFFAVQYGVPVALVFSDMETTEDIMRKRLMTLFEHDYFRSQKDQALWKIDNLQLLNSGSFRAVWASSVAKLGTHPYCIVHADEIDKPGWGRTSTEASALSLARERLETYTGASKYLKTSTPTDTEGNIIQELINCDIIYDWHVPCPHCGQFQPLRWSAGHAWGFQDAQYLGDDLEPHPLGQVVWEGGREASKEQIRTTSTYQCGSCKQAWSDGQRVAAVRAGKPVGRTPETGYETKIGFHWNRLYSSFSSLPDLVERWCTIQRMPAGDNRNGELQGFINSVLAEPWAILVMGEAKESDILAARLETLQPHQVPEGAIAITCGIDVQLEYFAYVTRAWSRDFTSWMIDYGTLPYDWMILEDYLFGNQHPWRIWRAGIDLRGGIKRAEAITSTDEVYDFVRRNGHRLVGRLCACYGGPPTMAAKVLRGKDADYTPSGHRLKAGIQTYQVNGHYAKIQVLKALERAKNRDPDRPAYLHSATGQDYAAQITAEHLVQDKDGKQEFRQTRPDNHYLDGEVLNYILVQPEFPIGGLNMIAGVVSASSRPHHEQPRSERPAMRAGGRMINPRRGR